MWFICKRNILIVLAAIFVWLPFNAQVKLSEVIQESKISSPENKALLYIDFWATWCGPCITAKEYLSVLQRQFSKDLYVISLSKESPLIVERFLKNKPTDLSVAVDYNGETFNTYNITKALPDGVLFNANGKVLWQGAAPDLKETMVAKYLRQNSARRNFESFFDIVEAQSEASTDYIPKEDLEVKTLMDAHPELEVVYTEHYLKLTGELHDIFSYLAKIYKGQIQLPEDTNKSYQVYFKNPLNNTKNLALNLVTYLGLDVERHFGRGEGINLIIKEPTFWDTEQINWGNNHTKYLIGDAEIKADNVPLKEVAYQLSVVLEMPILIPDDRQISHTLHDWDIHYKYFELMTANLKDSYGIIAEKKEIDYPVYHIKKRAP